MHRLLYLQYIRYARWPKILALIFLFLLPASSVWGANAVISSGGSTSASSPTPIALGDTLNIVGRCNKGTWPDSREKSYLRLFPSGSSASHTLGTYSSTSELDNVSASVNVGTTPYTEAVGAQFHIELMCRGSSSNGYATRYYQVTPKQKAPIVTASGDWAGSYTNGPLTIAAMVADAGSGVGKVWIKWTGESATNIEMTHSGGDSYKYDMELSKLPDGKQEVQVWAESPNHTNTGWQTIGSFTIDRALPKIQWDSSNPTYAKAGTVIKTDVSDAASGVSGVWIFWSGASQGMEMTSGPGNQYSYTLPTMPDGVKDVEIKAMDRAGNNTGWISKGRFTVDHKAPDIQWDSGNPAFTKGSVVINADISDAVSGVKGVWIKWTGASSTNIKMAKGSGNRYSYTIPSLPDGVKTVEIWAVDNAGNNTRWVDKGRFTVDRKAPVIQWDSDNPEFTNGEITIKADVSDTVSGVKDVWIKWTGLSSTNTKMIKGSGNQYSYAIHSLPAGVKRVEIWAADNAGNNTGWVAKGSFTVDKTVPRIEWLAPLDQAMYFNAGIRVTGNLIDEHPDHVTVEWQAENETAWRSDTRSIAGDGKTFAYDLTGLTQERSYRVRIRGTDKAGNVSEATPVRTIIGRYPANVLFREVSFVIADHSAVDHDHSGGFSQGDDLVYAIEVQSADTAAEALTLRYTLPPGLAMTPDTRPYFAHASAISDGAKLNVHWNGADDAQLLAGSVDLPANSKVVVHIPVTISADATPSILSTVLAGAKNAKDNIERQQHLTLQAKFPAHRALDLAFDSLQANWKYRQGTAFDYRIGVRVRAWDLADVELRYALPPGLEKNGDVRIEGDGAAAVRIDPAWAGNGEALLLASVPGVSLAALHSLRVIVPVKVSGQAAPDGIVQSTVEIRASNLDAPVKAMHHVVLEDTGESDLTLTKTVDQQTALPGDSLRYTITYTNTGIDDLHDLVIRDAFQSEYLTLGHAQCGPIAPKTLHCEVVAGPAPGALAWRLDGKLEAGDFGSVSYEVLVNRP